MTLAFGSDHYVPVLKAKRGEKSALRLLSKKVQARITPLLEVFERKGIGDDPPVSVPVHIDRVFKQLEESVAPFERYFLDCREVAPDGSAVVDEVFKRAAAFETPFVPVTGLSRQVDVAAAIEYRAYGVAIRLTRGEFETGRIPRELPAFLEKYGLAHDEVDLILDMGAADNMIAAGIEALGKAFLEDIPDPTRWRTLTLSGSAFPLSMKVVDPSSHDLIDRSEWLAWRDGLHASRQNFPRLPTFSDAVIQHPRGVEGFNPKFMSAAATTRIVTKDHWLLIKGVAIDDEDPSPAQFRGLATQLVSGHLRAHWAGVEHCVGCEGMKHCADGRPRLGSPEVWRRLGTIHHITCVVEQLGALTWT